MLFVAAGENDHDFWNELVQSSLRHLASTRDIYEPIVDHLGGTGRNCQARPPAQRAAGRQIWIIRAGSTPSKERPFEHGLLPESVCLGDRQVPSTANQANIVSHRFESREKTWRS
jgi:hypothetical protein